MRPRLDRQTRARWTQASRTRIPAAAVALLLLAAPRLFGQGPVPAPIHGVTVDDRHDIRSARFLPRVLDSLSHLAVKPTARIVFTPGNKKGPFSASSYLDATRQIRNVAYLVGQPVDSFYMHCFTPAEHLARFKDYVDTLGSNVDIWEVGNEINGEWLFGSTHKCRPKASVGYTSQADVVSKMTEAYDYVKSQDKVAALTLYYNTPCRRPAANEMFAWVDANVPARMKAGLDYVLVSYYEVDCAGHRPDWESLFRHIATIFPNSKLGISEFGWSNSRSAKPLVMDLISRYYALHPGVPNWVGGGFYWEFAIDMVPRDPRPESMWTAIDTAMAKQK